MKRLILCALIFVTSHAEATGQTGTVKFILGQFQSSGSSAGFAFFYLEGSTKIGSPPCAASYSQRWVINNNWPAAKLQNAVLMAASLTGKKVTVYGSDDSATYGDTETALYSLCGIAAV